MKFWSWGPTTIWHNMTGVQFFSSKITPQSCTGPWQPWRGDPLHGGALIIYILYTRGRLLGSCRFPCPSWQFLNGKLYTVPKLFPSQVGNFLLENCTLSQNYSEAPHKNESVTVWADASLYSMLYIKKKTGPTDYLWDSVGGCSVSFCLQYCIPFSKTEKILDTRRS